MHTAMDIESVAFLPGKKKTNFSTLLIVEKLLIVKQ